MAAKVEIVTAELRHVNGIARRMRADDVAECAAFGHTPKQALRYGVLFSDKVWTALVDGRPEAIFGVAVRSALAGDGTPWMLGTDAIYRHGRELLAYGPAIISTLFGSTPRLSNLVSARNGRAIRLLRRWGFEIGSEVTMIGGVEFLPFSVERPQLVAERENAHV